MMLSTSKLTFLICLLTCSLSWAGKESGGGSFTSLKFRILAKKGSDIIKQNKSDFPEVDIAKLMNKINSAKVSFVYDKLFDSDGVEVDALNFPDENTIKVDMRGWVAINTKNIDQMLLIMHEYLGLLKLDKGYQISSKLSEYVGASTEPPYYRWSCAAVGHATQFSKKQYLSGEGNTAIEAWNNLIFVASVHFVWEIPGHDARFKVPFEIRINDYHSSEFATFMNSCIRNDD